MSEKEDTLKYRYQKQTKEQKSKTDESFSFSSVILLIWEFGYYPAYSNHGLGATTKFIGS